MSISNNRFFNIKLLWWHSPNMLQPLIKKGYGLPLEVDIIMYCDSIEDNKKRIKKRIILPFEGFKNCFRFFQKIVA